MRTFNQFESEISKFEAKKKNRKSFSIRTV